MGLEEKRKIKEFQDNVVPSRSKELADICGSEIAYEVDWDSFGNDLQALNFFDNLAFHRINMAFRHLCTDDLARDAVKEQLKAIRLKNVTNKSDMRIDFSRGVLEMHCAYRLRLDGIYQEGTIGKVFDDAL